MEMNNYNRKKMQKASKQNQQIDCQLFYLPGLCTWTAYRIRLAGKTRTPCPSNINQDQQTLEELLWLAKIMETCGKYSIHRYGAKDSHNICQYRSGKSNIHIG